MSQSGDSHEAPEEDSLRWRTMQQTLNLGNTFSVARASQREGWRGADGATDEVIKQALQSVGVSTKAISALPVEPKVTPLPLIDYRHETASPVPLAKLKRRVITTPGAARAASTSAFDAKNSPVSAPRPATATAAAKQTSARAYQRSHVYGSADPGWRVPSKSTATASDHHAESSHDLSDAYMKRTMKQLQASDIDRALVEGSLSAAGSASSSPRTAHNISGLRSPVVIKTLAKAALQENHRLDPLSPRIYSGPSVHLLQQHASSGSEDDDAEDEYETQARVLLERLATSRKENVTELAAQFGRTADRLRAKEAEKRFHLQQNQTAADEDDDQIDQNRSHAGHRRKEDEGEPLAQTTVAPSTSDHHSAMITRDISTAQLDNSGDEGEGNGEGQPGGEDTGLRILGIQGYCNIPGASRGLMSRMTMKECLESASMLFKEAGGLLPQGVGELLGLYVWSCRAWCCLSHMNLRRCIVSPCLDISQWKTVTGSAVCALVELLAAYKDWTSISLSQHKIGNVAALACIVAVSTCGYSQLQSLAMENAGLSGSLFLMALSRLLMNTAGNVACASIDLLQRSREAVLTAKHGSHVQPRSSDMDKLLDPDRNRDIVAVKLCAARWASLSSAFDLQPAACRNLSKLLLKGNTFSCAGVVELMDALETNSTVLHLDLSSCRLPPACGASIGTMLRQNRCLQLLDLSWNQLGGRGVCEVARGLEVNEQLLHLLLQWNGCGDEQAMSAIATSLSSSSCRLQRLNLAHNRINGRQGSVLAEGVSRNVSVDHLVLDGNPLGAYASRKLMNAMSDASLEDSSETGLHAPRVVSMTDCHIGFVDPQMFDPANPAGTYSLDLADKYSRTVLQNMAVMQLRGNGSFASGTVRLDDKPWSVPTGDKVMQWQPPNKGIVSLTFISNRRPPKEDSTFSDAELQLYLTALTASKMQVERSAILHTLVTGESFLKSAQARLILSRCQGSTERVAFVAAAIYRIHSEMPPHQEIDRLRSQLTPVELIILDQSLGADVRTFTPGNPSGHYRLDLSKPPEREVAMRLMEFRNAEREWASSLPPAKGFLPVCADEVAEKHMRNMTIDGERVHMTRDFKLPKDGILSLDFTSIRKPEPGCCEVASDFVLTMRALPHDQRLGAAKQILGQKVVTLKQIKHLLKDWELHSADRVQLLVLAFARIVDYRGFFQLCDLLTKEEFALLQRRLGFHNIYDPFSSVHYYELDLSKSEHREIVAHIVRLAVLEPGDNVIDAWFCGLRFEIPAGWCQRLPKEGLLTLFYCREQGTIDKLVESEHADSVPLNYKLFQPAGTEWCVEEKKFQIKAKLQQVFPSAEACFKKLDTDGGGSLDRSEISRGLRDNGIWLFPDELVAFLDWLDQDGGGEVELDELEAFWNQVKVKFDEDLADWVPADAPAVGGQLSPTHASAIDGSEDQGS